MTAHPTWFVGNREPAITDVIRDEDGAPVDLTGETVRFRAREVGSSDLLVDQVVSNVGTLDATGVVEYEWQAADIDPTTGALGKARSLLVWWSVLSGPQDVNEAIIVVADHAPLDAYVEVEVFKDSTGLAGKSHADEDVRVALVAASRGLEVVYNRGFPFTEGPPGEVRYFSSDDPRLLRTDALIDVTELAVDYTGREEFATLIPDTDYRLEPTDADTRGEPFRRIYLLGARANWGYPRSGRPASVRVTGTFGFPFVPAGVKTATTIIAARLLERTRSAPFGIISFGVEGAAVRAGDLARDPEIRFAMSGARAPRKLVV